MRSFALLVLACLLLAGCAGLSSSSSSTPAAGTSGTGTNPSGLTTHPSTGTSTGQGTSSSSPASSGGQGSNNAPSVTQFVTNVSAGPAPLAVLFTFNATDADGDALTLTLNFGDATASQTVTGKTAAHTYTAKGNYTARLTASDGKASANRTALVKVQAASVTGATQDFSSSFLVDSPACAPMGKYDQLPSNDSPVKPMGVVPPTGPVPGIGVGADFLNYAKLVLEPGTVGKAYSANFASGAIEDHVLFLDATGASVGTAQGGFAEFLDPDPWTITGTIPATAASIVFYGCGNTGGEAVTYHAG